MAHGAGRHARVADGRGGAIAIALLLILASGLLVSGQENEAVRLDMHGEKTWTIRYGIGDSEGLASAGLAAYQINLDQSLAVDISGTALSVLSVKAHFNDQEAESLQALTVTLDADELQGVFGDFSLGTGQVFAVSNKKLKGMRLDYRIGEATLSGFLSQIEGISESRTFVGKSEHELILFSRTVPERPWVAAPYLQNLEGLYHYRLMNRYIEGFSEATVAFVLSDELEALL